MDNDTELGAVAAAHPYCLLCDKAGHQTDKCWSTHGMNDRRAYEIFRLVRAALASPPPSQDEAEAFEQLCREHEIAGTAAARLCEVFWRAGARFASRPVGALTYEQIHEWWASENGLEDCDMAKIVDFLAVVRAVEAKLAATPSRSQEEGQAEPSEYLRGYQQGWYDKEMADGPPEEVFDRGWNEPEADGAREADAQKRCQYCDDTGDVHGFDGEWRGRCSCPAGQASQPAPQEPEPIGEIVGLRRNDPDEFWGYLTPHGHTVMAEGKKVRIYAATPQSEQPAAHSGERETE